MSISNPNLPKSILALRSYTRQMFLHDLLAGITVGLVALPLAMAFGIASGVTPQAGLYTAVVAGFLISALGGSRTQIGGPTGRICGDCGRHRGALWHERPGDGDADGRHSAAGHGPDRAGRGGSLYSADGGDRIYQRDCHPDCIDADQGLFRFEDGAGAERVSAPHQAAGRALGEPELGGAGAGAGTLAILLLLPRFTKRVPASIVALLVCTGVSLVFHLPVETIGSKFGGIPRGLPPFAIPDFHSEHILPLIPSAFTVAMLAALESMLSAVVADGMTGDRHNPNVELVAQGMANIVSPLFGGIPATGAIARTATNIRSGARSPVCRNGCTR